jgi:hypothetical protein
VFRRETGLAGGDLACFDRVIVFNETGLLDNSVSLPEESGGSFHLVRLTHRRRSC